MYLCLFSRKVLVLGFPIPNFLSTDLRVSRGNRTMVYRIWSSSVVPLTFPGHSLVSIHGEDPLTPPDKLREPIFFAWNSDLAAKRSTSWLWKLSGSCSCWQELFHFNALLTFFLQMNVLTSLALISTKLRFFFLIFPLLSSGNWFFVYNDINFTTHPQNFALLEWCVLSNRLKYIICLQGIYRTGAGGTKHTHWRHGHTKYIEVPNTNNFVRSCTFCYFFSISPHFFLLWILWS